MIRSTRPAGLDRLLDASVALGFSKIGYALRSRDWEPPPRMEGRRVLVTGATGGIGFAAAKRMAALGAHVTIVGRSRDKMDRAVEEIGHKGATGIIEDLSLLAGVRRLVERVADAGPLHVLVNNVGVLLPERRVTSEGIEATLATNLLGHYVLTESLTPLLERSSPSRIVNVTSGGMYTQKIDVEDLQNERGYRGSVAYARTKRGQVVLTQWWASKLRDRGVVVHAMHPGWVDTEGVRRSLPTFRMITGPVLRNDEQGADTIVWLAASDEAGRITGRLWHDRAQRPIHRLRSTKETAQERQTLVRRLGELSRSR